MQLPKVHQVRKVLDLEQTLMEIPWQMLDARITLATRLVPQELTLRVMSLTVALLQVCTLAWFLVFANLVQVKRRVMTLRLASTAISGHAQVNLI